MKILYTILLLLISLNTNAFAKNYCIGDAKACYLFSEGSGTTVADSSANSRTGTFTSSGHPAWSATVPSYAGIGKARGSVVYASGDYVSLGTTDDILTENGAMTFVAWVDAASMGIGTSNGRIFQRNTVSFFLTNSGSHLLDFQVAGGTTLDRATSSGGLTFGTWAFVAITWDGSTTAANVHIYVNGTETSYVTTTNGVTPTDNSTDASYIGNRADTLRTFDGNITDVGIFNRALTSTEITDIYNHGLTGTQGGFFNLL